ncbi:DUF1492 domain-containing protein [Papillibacter cinnamivorans]|uniref:Sigma-70, region 4 n=1 Tax=Papillibacter cinnamivorans DSM 12816 TaxID=1122930 RepID=A0A1W1YQI6_9FIRM|nr:DUF1492 domain-containing protein [Papillibacter cinnamivorans]SMC38396.1 Protein of unknown function [Papillibacter cinnamivorans DSM 12816]
MTAKEYLMQYREAYDAISDKLDEIRRLLAMATKMNQTISSDRVSASHNQDKLSSAVARIADMKSEIDDEMKYLIEMKRIVLSTINSIPNKRQRRVLRLRYINGMRWEEIAVKIERDYRWVHRLHGKALIEVEKIILK